GRPHVARQDGPRRVRLSAHRDRWMVWLGLTLREAHLDAESDADGGNEKNKSHKCSQADLKVRLYVRTASRNPPYRVEGCVVIAPSTLPRNWFSAASLPIHRTTTTR